MTFKSSLFALAALPFLLTSAFSVPRQPAVASRDSSLPTVTLNYTTVQAASSSSNNAGTYYTFSNIRYAAPPVGDLRWAEPQDPLVETSVNNGTWSTSGTNGCSQAEDCLFLDVYVPESALDGGAKLPVLFWNYGGGWTGGSKSLSPAGLFNVSSNGIIIVAYNYRLDIFGVLNGPTLQRSGGISNVAVYDAHKAMEWTYQYISQFGGDPEEITNWGFSAGGSQVVVSLTAFGGHKWTPRFKRAMINSPGWVPGAGHAHAEQFLQNVTSLVNCPWDSASTMSCLKNTSFSTLLAASQNITSTYTYQMQPRADGVVLPDTSEYLFSIGQFHKNVTVLVGHSANESTPSLTASLSSEASLRAELKVLFPSINDWAIDQLIELYPIGSYGSYTTILGKMAHDYDLDGKILPATIGYGNKTYNYISNLGSAGHGSEQEYFFYDASSSSSTGSSSSTSGGTPSSSNSTSSSGSTSGGASSISASGTGSASMSAGASEAAGASASATASGTMPSSSGTSSNSTSSGGPSGSSTSSSGGSSTSSSSSSSSSDTAWIAKQMQEWLISFVTTGNPNSLFGGDAASVNQNGTSISSWPQYGNASNVVSFADTGFSIVGDELDSAQTVWWNKVLWY